MRPEFLELAYVQKVFKSSPINPTIMVGESHGDHVSRLPEGGVNLAYSERTENEIWQVGDSVLAVQGHPEFNYCILKEMIIDRIHRLGRIDDAKRDELLSKANETNHMLNRNLLTKIILSFMWTE